MSDHQKPTLSKSQAVRCLTAATIGAALLSLSGLTLTGTVIALIMATPVLVLFSPILVLVGIVTFLITTGFLFSGGCGVAALAALSWTYSYVAGKHPPVAEQLDRARMKIAEKARDFGHYVQHKAQEATATQT